MLDTFRLAASIFQQVVSAIFHFITAHYFQELPDPSLSSRTMKNIVILGGSYAGVSTAHRILKQAAKLGPFKITLVSPETEFYWNMASARGIVPGQFSDEKLFKPIAPGFGKYPATQFEFLLASAQNLDVEAKTVEVSGATGQRILDYDFIILATGSRTKNGTPLKGLGSTEATKNALHDFQGQIKKAKTIVVAGGGVTSIELAGELAYEYGRQKEVILVSLRYFSCSFLREIQN
jgi:NADH dehydrogenase FAD-containing subunit